jgi:parallel beta-helix repeat protein
VLVNGGTNDKPDSTFSLDLIGAGDATVIKPHGTGTIQDDSTPISVDDVTSYAPGTGTTAFAFTLSLAHASSLPVSVDFATSDGTAKVVNGDYQAQSGTVTFNPGETTKTIKIVVNGNSQSHPAETFFVNLVNPVNGVLTANAQHGVGTILANAGAQSYYVNDASTVGDVFCTGPGNDSNDGKTPATPVATLSGLLSRYTFHPEDTIYVDTGSYEIVKNITLGPQFSGVRILGAGPRQVTPTSDGSSVLGDGPLAFWRLGDAGGAAAADATGNGHNGTYVGHVTPYPDAPSKDGAAQFDGSGSHVSVPGISTTTMPQFSIEAWVDYEGPITVSSQIVAVQVGSYQLSFSSGNIFFAGGYYYGAPQAHLIPGVWTHVVATVDASAKYAPNAIVNLYIDGRLVVGPISIAVPANTGQPFEIGSGTLNGTGPWSGSIDEVALYNKILTPAQIQAHYASTVYTGTGLDRGNTSSGSYGIELAGATKVSISDLSISGAQAGIYADGGSSSTDLTIDDVDVFGNVTGIDLESSNDRPSVLNSTVHGASTYGIYIASASPLISGSMVFGNGSGIVTYGSRPTITGNTLRANHDYGIEATLLDQATSSNDHGVISENYIETSGTTGIYATISYQTTAKALLTVADNTVGDGSGEGIRTLGQGVIGDQILLDGNTVSGNTGTGIIPADESEVRDNVVVGNHDGISQTIGGGSFGTYTAAPITIDRNQVYGNTGVGISALVGTVISYNNVYSNFDGIEGVNYYYSSAGYSPTDLIFDGTIKNNLIYGNTNSAVILQGANGATIANNTIYQPKGDGVRVTSAASGDVSKNVTLSNNIIWTQVGYDINASNNSQQGFRSNYNLLYTTGVGDVGFWQSGFSSLKGWQTNTGLDVRSITGDPKFVNLAGQDGILGVDPTTGINGGADDNFHLQNGSPAVAAGDPASDPSSQPAPSGGRINLGAYGGTPEATTTAPAGVIVAQPGGSTDVTVGGSSGSYTVSLSSPPSADVAISLTHDKPLTLSATSLTFTPANWSVPQAVTVKQTGPPGLAGDYTVTVAQTVTSHDARYNGLPVPGVTVTVHANGTLTVNMVRVLDFDGAGHTELALFRPSTSQWFAFGPTGGHLVATFGLPNLGDIPVPGDYDGVGHAEPAVFRPSTSQWIVLGPGGSHVVATFGAPNLSDIPVPGDYDGTGKTEPAVFRPSTGQWFVYGSNGGRLLTTFGATGLKDIPVSGNFDGVGHAEPAVFRPATSQWFVYGPTGGHLVATFGAPNLGDIPVPGDYDGVGHAEPAVFRPATSQWFVLGPSGGHLTEDASGRFGAPNLTDIPLEGQAAVLVRLGKVGGIHGKSVPQGPTAPRASARTPLAPSVSNSRAVTSGQAALTPREPVGSDVLIPLDTSEVSFLLGVSGLGGRRRRVRDAWISALAMLAEEVKGTRPRL